MPYEAREARGFTRKANTKSRSRQWVAVYESSRSRGDNEGTAITKANGVAKKSWTKSNPSRRMPRDFRPDEMKTAGVLSYLKSKSRRSRKELDRIEDEGARQELKRDRRVYGVAAKTAYAWDDAPKDFRATVQGLRSDRESSRRRKRRGAGLELMDLKGDIDRHERVYGKIAGMQGAVVKAPKIGSVPKVVSMAPRNMTKVVAAPKVARLLGSISFAKSASTSVSDTAKELFDPENPPGRIGRWKRLVDRVVNRREKTALRMTSAVRLKGMRGRKKFPTVKAHDLQDLSKRMTGEARRMSTEAGKGPVVSKKKLWRQHSRRGGRHEDVSKSFEASRTFTMPPESGQGAPGMRTVQFKDKPAGAKKAPAAAKAKRSPAGKK